MPTPAPPERGAEARARLARTDLDPLWREARRRLEDASRPVARLTLHGLSAAQQAAIADLLGWARLPGTHVSLSVAALDRALLASPVRLDTRGVVEALGGPLVNRREQRLAARQQREQLWHWLSSQPIVEAEPALHAWVDWVQGRGLARGSAARTRRELERTLAVLEALPADGRSLSAFAEQVCGDPHALDDGTRLGGYVVRALACLRGGPVPRDAPDRRQLWAEAGVACDALSTSVLTAGLRPEGDGPLATTLRRWADEGHAVAVTLAQLQSDPLGPLRARRVWVVENPAVLAEALRVFGVPCPAVICTSGWPNVAAITLLRQLAAVGAPLAYHGDLDGEGLRIAAYVVDKTGAKPWRMHAADYRAAVGGAGPPAGRVTDVPWDAQLGAELRAGGVAVPEERVMGLLLRDLARGE